MYLKPQDVVVALGMLSGSMPSNYADKAKSLYMSASEVHAAERRLASAGLLEPKSKHINREALVKFLFYGVPHAFAASPAEITRGIPTGWAAPVLKDRFSVSNEMPPVWPDPMGKAQGSAVKPLYKSVPKAIKDNPSLYALLALVDALRIGRARERKMAEEELNHRIKDHAYT